MSQRASDLIVKHLMKLCTGVSWQRDDSENVCHFLNLIRCRTEYMLGEYLRLQLSQTPLVQRRGLSNIYIDLA